MAWYTYYCEYGTLSVCDELFGISGNGTITELITPGAIIAFDCAFSHAFATTGRLINSRIMFVFVCGANKPCKWLNGNVMIDYDMLFNANININDTIYKWVVHECNKFINNIIHKL